MEWLSDPQAWIGLLTLTVLEIVLGIDNVISKGYPYFAMAFAVFVELLNLKMRKQSATPVRPSEMVRDSSPATAGSE